MYSDEFISEIKEKLNNEKKRIEEKIRELTGPEDHMDNPHWDETANDAIEDIEQEAYLRIYRELLDKIDIAMSKIQNNTYGVCAECDKEIPKESLEREPWAEHCGKICSGKQS